MVKLLLAVGAVHHTELEEEQSGEGTPLSGRRTPYSEQYRGQSGEGDSWVCPTDPFHSSPKDGNAMYRKPGWLEGLCV